jgi:hypothetical protein
MKVGSTSVLQNRDIDHALSNGLKCAAAVAACEVVLVQAYGVGRVGGWRGHVAGSTSVLRRLLVGA